jgi:hypothetical protein
MKFLKITLLVAILSTVFTSCTEEELNDDTVLVQQESTSTYYTGGDVDD